MKYLKWAGAVLAVVAVLVVGVGFLLPSTARVERSAVVDVPPCTAYAYLEGFQRFNEFSPWAKLDPNAVYTFDGPTYGKGAQMSWTSDNQNVGNGSQEILDLKACERVDIQLDFGPNGRAQAYWVLAPEGSGTKVTWGFFNDFGYNLIGRGFGLAMDSLLGKDYEDGIAGFKTMVEAGPKADLANFTAESLDLPKQAFVHRVVSTPKDVAAIEAAVTPILEEIGGWLPANGLSPAGAPVVRTVSDDGDHYQLEVGFPVAEPPTSVPEGWAVGTLGGPVLKVVHKGAFDGLEQTHARADAWIAVRRLETEGARWEAFPESEVPTAEIYIPLRTAPK